MTCRYTGISINTDTCTERERKKTLNSAFYTKQVGVGTKRGKLVKEKAGIETCTCQFSGWSSLETCNVGSSSGTTVYFPSLGTEIAGLSIHDIRSIFIIESSLQRAIFFLSILNSLHLVDFFQRCSKLIRTSYAAGPSILQCKSCHGCLGALVPA